MRGTRRWTTVAVTVFAVFAAVLGSATPALAHAELVSSTPAEGAAVDSLPTTASLVFSEALDPATIQIALTDATGATTALPPFTPDGATVHQPLPAGLAPGAWTLAYRVVSEDGHPVGGTIGFTVVQTAVAGGTTPSGSTSSSGTPATTSAPSTPATAPSTAAAAATTDAGAGALWWVLAAVAVVVVAGVVLLLARRRRSPTA